MQQSSSESGYPVAWKFGSEDPLELAEGGYVSTTTAPSDYGDVPVVNLRVNGEPRAIWCSTRVLREKFAEELRRRGARDFEQGERITIRRGADKKTSSNGKPYWPWVVVFHDAPKTDAASVLGADVHAPADDLPY